MDDVDGPKRKIDGWSNQFITTPASRAIIARCHDALQQATATAQTDEQKQRVALFVKCFAFSESLFDLAEAPTDEARYNHAVDLAKKSKGLTNDIVTQIGQSNFDAATNSATTLSRTCRTCHTFYKKE